MRPLAQAIFIKHLLRAVSVLALQVQQPTSLTELMV